MSHISKIDFKAIDKHLGLNSKHDVMYEVIDTGELIVGQVTGMHGIIMSLENRIKNMNNDMIKLDIQISDALNLRQDEERISRADGKEDARRD